MSATTKIQWAHHTFNPWIGCTKVSPACENCYAEVSTPARRARSRGVETWGKGASRIVTSDAYWREPLLWDRKAAAAGERRRVFCASLADVFEEHAGPLVDFKGDVLWVNPQREIIRAGLTPVGDPVAQGYRTAKLDDARLRLFRLIEETPNLDWLLLTKRPQNIAMLAPGRLDQPNIWWGVTVESPDYLWRLRTLLEIPRARRQVTFVSNEPALERIDWRSFLRNGPLPDWIIWGGESGAHSRASDVELARGTRDFCREAGIAFFLKQLGGKPYVEQVDQDATLDLQDRKGGDPDEWPLDLRVREFPK